MKDVTCDSSSSIGRDSELIDVLPNKKYITTTEVVGVSGLPYSAFFGVTLFDEKGQEIEKIIQWLNDFSGVKKNYSIIFTTPSNCQKVQLVYRINIETPVKSLCHYFITPANALSVTEADPKLKDDYTSPHKYILSRIEELTPDQESSLERKIVWIFGARRSGTTWLGKELLSFDTYYMHEPNISDHLAVQAPEALEPFTRRIDLFKDYYSYFFCENFKNTWQYYLRKLIIYRFYAETRDLRKTIIVKEPSFDIDASDIISACMPQSKMILLIRDARDIIDSHIDARREGGWQATHQSAVIDQDKRMEFIENHSRAWVKQISTLIKSYSEKPEHLRLMVKYEDLRHNTFDTVQQIYKFLGIEIPTSELNNIIETSKFENIPAHMRGSGKFYRSASPGKWRENFNDEEKDVMWQLMGSTLIKLGYSY